MLTIFQLKIVNCVKWKFNYVISATTKICKDVTRMLTNIETIIFAAYILI